MRYEADAPLVVESQLGQIMADLPPALETGNYLIDDEHRLLLGIMKNLRRVCVDPDRLDSCRGCDRLRQNACEKEVVSQLGDLFAFILDHFSTEESIMRDSLLLMVDQDLCEAHIEDHAAIAEKVQEIVARLDRMKTVERIHELDALLARWIEHHIVLHDVMLVRWMSSDQAALARFSAMLPPPA